MIDDEQYLEQWKATAVERSRNPMVYRFGKRVESKCQNCQEFVKVVAGPKRYYKCLQRGDSRSAATDHRQSWTACGLFTQRK